MNDAWRWSARDTAAAVNARQCSAVEVARSGLARLQAVASPRLPAAVAASGVRPAASAASRRALSAAAASPEAKMSALLRDKLGATHVEVKDVSGGCGSFYIVTVVSPRFEGLSPIKQHRCVCAQ